MRKRLLLGLLLLSALAGAQNMKDVFVNMPDSLCPLLTKVNRADFADFLESNMRAQVKNKLDKMSEMKQLTKDYLLLETTSASTIQMKLLPVNDSVKVVCVVSTVNGPASDSEILFYSTDWKELPLQDYLTTPSADAFLLQSDTIDTDKRAAALSSADMSLLKADLSADNNSLSFTYTTIDYLDKDAAKALLPFLKSEPLIFEWNEGRY